MRKVGLDYNNSSILFGGLLLISIIAFWPTYYAVFFDSVFYIHFHAFFAILWFGMLIVQPYLIKSKRLELHRLLGKFSYLVAPFVVVSVVLLAHERLASAPESFYPIQTYILYLQISLVFAFAVTYGLAILYRKAKPIHSRLMAATAFSFIDPIFARLFNTFAPEATWNSQVISFMFINIILLVLCVLDRNNRKAKWVYPGILVLYVIIEIPIFFNLTGGAWWQAFANWFGSF